MSRIILDEGVPRQVGDHLPRHSVTTVPIEGWASVKNGKLLALIGKAGFSAFISADKNGNPAVTPRSSICDTPAKYKSLAIHQTERRQNS